LRAAARNTMKKLFHAIIFGRRFGLLWELSQFDLRMQSVIELVNRRLYAGLMSNASKKKIPRALMLGVGLDSDGHKRLTTGPNFALVGGSQETHEQMTEKAVKINEKLKARGKQLETVTHEEFDDIAQEVGLKKAEPKKIGRG
jgi:hypothetical protein